MRQKLCFTHGPHLILIMFGLLTAAISLLTDAENDAKIDIQHEQTQRSYFDHARVKRSGENNEKGEDNPKATAELIALYKSYAKHEQKIDFDAKKWQRLGYSVSEDNHNRAREKALDLRAKWERQQAAKEAAAAADGSASSSSSSANNTSALKQQRTKKH